MLLDTLQTDMVSSLKAGKADRVETIRFLIAAVRNAAIAKYGNAWETSVKDADVVEAVKKQVKTHRESIEAFEKAGRTELAEHEKKQLAVLSEFAPKEMTDEELKQILEPVVATGEQNFGILMKNAMVAVAGRAEGGRVSAMLREFMQK